ncbi:MAG: alpha/beta hydrolase [Planctomycetaceae bacterium]|nr:alpha/beta hydrolase [Planctomycetaceae bacterium]
MSDRSQSILDSPAISGCYLFPQPRRVPEPFLVDCGDAQLACYRKIVDGEAMTLVHFHGNGEAVADYLPDVVDGLSDLGLNSLFVEYREYGGSTGQAQLVAMLGDGEAVLHTAGLAPQRTIVFGRSIGSLYAIELARRHPQIAGLIIESGIANPGERFLAYTDLSPLDFGENELLAEVKRHFDHKAKLSSYTGPLLVMHTEHDGVVEISHAERNHRWAGSTQKQLLRLSRGDHNSIMALNWDEYFRAIGSFAKAVTQR